MVTREEIQIDLARIAFRPGATSCAGDNFLKNIRDNAHCERKLGGFGTFYLYYTHPVAPGDKKWCLRLAFFSEESKQIYTSSVAVFASEKIPGSRMTVIDMSTFLVDNALVKMNEDWSNWSYRQLDSQTVAEITDHLCHQSGLHTSIHKTGLAQIHENAESDFCLKSEDGQPIRVHKTVLEGLWPFFRGMVESKMKEVAQKCVKLPVPKSTLDVMVRYFYGEDLELELDDAANLIVAAQMYDLPELLDIAVTKVKSEEMDVSQAVYVWQKSFEAQNEDLRSVASKRIEELMPDTDNFDDSIQHLAKKQLVCLFQDISTAMPSKRRKGE